ncbi:putative ankyrin repeat-containing domain, PGG domain, ankyrin repeat-containing domain superfamily [Helianthus debilis subsp. tardiflorus]
MAEKKQVPAAPLVSISEDKGDVIIPFGSLTPLHPLPDLLDGSREDYINVAIPLYEASIKGDWKAAKAIIDKNPGLPLLRCSITENCETPLHIAASADKSKRMQEFVKNLVGMMETKDLELQNKSFNTALCLAAAAGNVEMVKILVKKNRALLIIPGSSKMMPLYMATLFGDHATVEYLYSQSNKLGDDGWTHENRAWLLQKCVEANLFDIALQIVQDIPELASSGNVLGVLAKKPEAFSRTTSNVFKKSFNWVFARPSKPVPPKKDGEALQLLRSIWKNVVKLPKKEIDDILRGQPDPVKKDDRLPYNKEDQKLHLLKLISEKLDKISVEIQKPTLPSSSNGTKEPAKAKPTYSSRVLFVAAEVGNTKFIVELIRMYPDLIWKVNENNQSIFHIAVKHRHEGIYNLLYEIGSMKDLITPLKDENENNMLHLVGKSAKQKRLQDVSGVALQMQRELLWFQEVEAMIPSSYRERKNKDGLTPHELFTKEHKDLVVQGEKWMKETASQCMVVAALIATIVFAAAFTVPGGYSQGGSQGGRNQTEGIPVFHYEPTFMVFVVADAISLFASAASILMFLSILTSRYAERDFLQSLPKKLMLGLSTLFLSMTTMTIAFSVSFFVLYKNGLRWMPIVISLFAVMPIFLFAWLQYPLLGDVTRSTYGSRYLFKPKKRMLYYEDPEPNIIMRFFSRWSSSIFRIFKAQ